MVTVTGRVAVQSPAPPAGQGSGAYPARWSARVPRPSPRCYRGKVCSTPPVPPCLLGGRPLDSDQLSARQGGRRRPHRVLSLDYVPSGFLFVRSEATTSMSEQAQDGKASRVHVSQAQTVKGAGRSG